MFRWRCFSPANVGGTRCILNASRLILASQRIRSVTDDMERTFQYQDSLPSLPVPYLDQTCDKYLDSVKPHLTELEFMHTQFLVNQFCTGIGKDLQKKLEIKAQKSRNWLKHWWEENAYFKGRYPSAPLVNVGGQIYIGDIWPPKEGTQLKRAALYTHAFLQTWKNIYRQTRAVDKMGSTPLCMDQFMKLFACCKLPGKDIDSLKTSFQTAPADTPRHIIVQVRGRIFSCPVLDNQLEPFAPPLIERLLEQITTEAWSKPSTHPVCSLTAADRTSWYEFRERLISLHEKNKSYLDAIESSLFAIVLDEHSPITGSEIAAQCVFGDCTNRWFDKAMTLLFFKSGTLGMHCDHAPFDGIVPVTEAIAACDMLRKTNQVLDTHNADEVPQPYELEFTVDDVIVQGIEDTIQKYDATASTMNAIIYSFTDFGKNLPKQHKVHPDTFVQLAIQLAYFRLHGRPAPTYETGQTRLFYHGRTETVRSCTVEALRWCKAMVDPNESSVRKTELLREARVKHDRLMKDARSGKGIDRHLMGLRLIAAEEGLPTPQIYLDKGWTASGGDANFILSTSCGGFKRAFGGCAAMVQDGYGVFYSIEELCIDFHIATFNTSRVTDDAAFQESLRISLTSMAATLLAAKF